MEYILTYHGKPVTSYDYCRSYNAGDCVIDENRVLYKSLQDFNVHNFPDFPSSCFYQEKIGTLNDVSLGNLNKKQEKEMKIIRGDHVGSIFGDNVVIYGDNNGNISTSGEKSVVVVFGDVTGNITADRVIRLDNANTYPEWVQTIESTISKKQGDNHA